MIRQLTARPHVILAAVATGVEFSAVGVILGVDEPFALAIAVALHLLAVQCAALAGRKRRPELSQVESDLILTVALLVPVFGPTLAWFLPLVEGGEEVENSHQVFERYAEHVKPHVPDYERSLFTGNYEKDIARELDAESYHEVLRHGSTDQKRNALRRLAGLGEPKHFELIRKCLLDPEHEVRLYAYNELERAGTAYEEEIAELTRALTREPEEGETFLALSRAYFEYAASGIHDDEMAAFYFRSAERYASQARAHGILGPEPVWLRAGALTRLGEFEDADRCLASLGEAEREQARSCLVRADLAFRRRDFATARTEARRIREAGEDLPEWLQALEAEA
jgi:tetratricopeptide (TPR) repeat protein